MFRYGRGLLLALGLTSCCAPSWALDVAGVPPTSPTPLTPAPAPFFIFSDTQVAYYYEATARQPGVTGGKAGNSLEGRSIPKNVLSISHTNVWEYGTNFVLIDILKSGSQDPAGTGFPYFETRSYGATEAYGFYRGTLGGNEIFNTKAFSLPGIYKNISLAFGFDQNTKNTSFGPRTQYLLAGALFSLDVPVGFMNFGIYIQKEWNRNGLLPTPARNYEFEPVPHFEMVYSFPLAFTGLPLSIAGFNNLNFPKGRDSFNEKTYIEFLSRTNLVLDVGKLIWDQPNRLDAFIGFQYWLNKFGTNSRTIPGAEEKTFLAGVSVHVF